MHHDDIVLFGQGHHPFKEIQFDTLRGGIGRKTENNHLRLRNRFTDRPFQFHEKVDTGNQRNRAHLGTGKAAF